MLVELDDGYVINTDKIIFVRKNTLVFSKQYHPKFRWWRSSWGTFYADITDSDRERIFDAMGIYRANGQIDGIQFDLNVSRLNRPAKVSDGEVEK